MELSSNLALRPPRAHLTATGELDAFAAARIRPGLEEAIDLGCTQFNIDVSDVTFVDAAGLGILVRLINTVTLLGGGIEIVAASSRFRRTARMAGLGAAFGLEPPVDVRATSVPAAASRRDRRVVGAPPPSTQHAASRAGG